MNKAIISIVVSAGIMSGCASISYETQCALPLESTPSDLKIESATKLIRENHLYTERVYYSKDEWVIFADKTNRNMAAKSGDADYIHGTGNFLVDSELAITDTSFVKGQWSISQTNPKCFSLERTGELDKGFLSTNSTYPFVIKDEMETNWKVDYFDFYHPMRIDQDGKLTLKHKVKENSIEIDLDGGLFTVNGEEARLVSSGKPFSDAMLKTEASGDTYLIIGMLRQNGSNKYYVLKNDMQLLVMSGPQR